jgi:hypothetical protein
LRITVANTAILSVIFTFGLLCVFAATASVAAEANSDERQPLEVVRSLRDPHTGQCWQLTRQSLPSGGPGRMIQVSDEECAVISLKTNGMPRGKPEPKMQTPAIRAGDRLIVEETSAVVEARFAAVALSPAVLGATFNARMQIGGRVVRVIALGSGRAAFAANMEVER